jgi:Flp pilus assembly CpaF family ATPase
MSEPLTLSRQTLNVLEHELRAIKPYLDDPLVQEVMVNNPHTVFVERAGQTLLVDARITEDSLRSLIVAMSNANEKTLTPLLDARLPGLRVAATLPPVAVHGPPASGARSIAWPAKAHPAAQMASRPSPPLA